MPCRSAPASARRVSRPSTPSSVTLRPRSDSLRIPLRMPASVTRFVWADRMRPAAASDSCGGPVLTWRTINNDGFPLLANWSLSLGDIELFWAADCHENPLHKQLSP
jgi:hypothetical protein